MSKGKTSKTKKTKETVTKKKESASNVSNSNISDSSVSNEKKFNPIVKEEETPVKNEERELTQAEKNAIHDKKREEWLKSNR